MKVRLQKPLEMATVLNKEVGEQKSSEENGLVAVAGDAPNGAAKPATEKRVVVNGVANGC